MFVRRMLVAICAAALPLAQTSAPPSTSAPATTVAAVPDGGMPSYIHPETPQQRKDRLGTVDDPGMNPDPKKHYWRFGRSYHVSPFERRWAAYDQPDPGFVRPLGMVNFAYEIYQQNEKYVWVWVADTLDTAENPAEAAAAPSGSRWKPEHIAFFKRIRSQFSPLVPPASDKTIVFQESSDGLPKSGSWRNSLAVADMNEDGFPDIVAPPSRKGTGLPQIFLGDGKGHWTEWKETTWPHGLDYGGVVAADFNKDGHMDLAFAVHLSGLYVFLGDGKGHFTEVTEGLPRDFPTRRVAVADVDADGDPDLIVSSEGPASADAGENAARGRLRAYLNRRKGHAWKEVDVVAPDVKVGGDWLSVGNFNGDRYPDIIASSVYFGATEVVQLSKGAKRWSSLPTDGDSIPSMSYYLASATGKFVKGSNFDDAIIAYTRFWPSDLDRTQVATPQISELTNIDRLTFTKDGVKRTPIMRWSGHVGVRGVAVGDFDGDGNLDIVVTREETGEVLILLGDGKGNFTLAPVEGLKLDPNRSYDVKVADVNLDGRPDILLMYESSGTRGFSDSNGSIKVFLNRGSKRVSSATVAK